MPAEAKFTIDVLVFRPIGSLTTTTIAMTLAGAVPNPGEGGATTPSGVTLVGNYFIRVNKYVAGANPDDPDEPMKLKFYLTNRKYLLQGIAFSNRDQGAGNNLGQAAFTTIEIGPEPGTNERVLTVTNARGVGKKQSYDYLILIQQVSDGAVGIIDPEMENET